MGQTQQHVSQKQLQGFEKTTVDKQNKIALLKNIETKQERIIRQWQFFEKPQFEKHLELLSQRQSYSNQHLQKLTKFNSAIFDNYCKQVYYVYAVWEHEAKALHDEIKQRINQKSKFTEKQIRNIAAGCIQALETMERNKSIHEKLTVWSIKLNNNGEAIVTDPLLLPCFENYSMVYKNILTDRIYLSPEEVNSLQMQTLCIKSNKNDVWALGMILLQVGLLEAQNQCYLEDCRKINWVRVKQNLNKFGKMYGEKLQSIVASMLEQNKKLRPSWSQMRQKILQQQDKMTSVMKKTENAFLTTGESPQVLAYKSMLSEQTEIYSFSRNKHLKLNNPIIYEQKENYYFNQGQIPVQYGGKFMKPVVNFVKPEARQVPTYIPIQKSMQFGGGYPVYNPQVSYNQSVLTSLTNHHPSQIKKFTSSASSRGYLFDDQKQISYLNKVQLTPNPKPQVQVQVQIPQNKPQPNPTTEHIQKTESITYQGDFRPMFHRHHHKTDYEQNDKIKLTENQKQEQVHNRDIQGQVLPEESGSVGGQRPGEGEREGEGEEQGEIQEVIENFQVGSRYQGQKLKNMRHGQGRFYYQDGGMYDGSWQYNKMHGKGKLYYRSGALAYDGFWKNDQFQGKGKLYNQTPQPLPLPYNYSNFDNIDECWQYYQGDFIDDMKQGRGKLMLTNGQYYVGSFSQDMIQGNGKFVGKGGVVKGYWEGNQLMRVD